MNFLFLTTMMILIFSLISNSMTISIKTAVISAKSLEMLVTSKLKADNAHQLTKYNKSKKSKKTPKTNKDRAEKRKSKEFILRKNCSGEDSKLNLYPLINGAYTTTQKSLLTKTFKNLLTEIYKDHPFYHRQVDEKTGFLDSFVKHMITGLKKEKSLAKISFPSRKEREFYVKLCVGSKSIPSLLTYVTVQADKDAQHICFEAVHKEILLALLGQQTYKKLSEAEKKVYFSGRNNSRLHQNEITKLLAGSNYISHREIIRYKRKRNYKAVQKYLTSNNGHLITQGKPQQLNAP